MLREVPINQLLSANDLPTINAALLKIFEQLKNMKNQEQIYPKTRQIQLIEALSRDFTNQMLKVISARPVMEIDDNEFNREVAKYVHQIF